MLGLECWGLSAGGRVPGGECRGAGAAGPRSPGALLEAAGNRCVQCACPRVGIHLVP